MTLILNNEEVEQVLSMDMCLEVLEEAFTDLGRDVAVNQLRMHTYVSQESSRSSYRLKTMNGAVPRFGVMALRIASDVVRFPTVGGSGAAGKDSGGAGKNVCGIGSAF